MKIHTIKAPAEVITISLNIPELYKQECIQEAYKIGDQQNQRTNVKAIMSSYEVWRVSNVYSILLRNIEKIIPQTNINVDNKYHLTLSSAWTAIYKEGHYTKYHCHHPSYLSFVYYLKANQNTSPLVFDDCDFEITPQDDLLVIFPSYLFHSVPKHIGEDRICVAGNFDMVPN